MSVEPARRVARLERTLIRQIFDAAPPDALNLGLGQPDLPTPPHAALAGVRAITEGRTGYTTTAGDPALRSAVAAAHAPFATGAEQVVITVGTQEALFAAVAALVDPGDEILVPDPGYPAYPVVADLLGARARRYPLRAEHGFRLQHTDVLEAMTARTRAVIVCSPANPTGAVHRDDELAALGAGLGERGVAWISDEVYSGFVYGGSLPSLSAHSTDGILISGVSKNLSMTGWRIGWIVAPLPIARRVAALHQYLVTCAPSISQRAALAAFDAEGRAASRRYREIFRRRRDLMAAELQRLRGIRFERPDGAFYFFVDVSAHGSSLELARRVLERRKVVTIPGEAFGEGGAGYLRLSFAAREQDIRIGVREIGRELGGG